VRVRKVQLQGGGGGGGTPVDIDGVVFRGAWEEGVVWVGLCEGFTLEALINDRDGGRGSERSLGPSIGLEETLPPRQGLRRWW